MDTPPAESTLHKLFARLDAPVLDTVFTRFAWCRIRLNPGRRVIAIDGKTVRGAHTATSAAPHLIAALNHTTGAVIGQHQVETKSNEIPAVRDLLTSFDPRDLQGAVITVDAMHTQHETAKTICDAGADYIFTVKANQPKLLTALKKLPWTKVRTSARTTQTGHGRHTTRTLKTVTMSALPHWPEFPHATQAAQLRHMVTKQGKKTT